MSGRSEFAMKFKLIVAVCENFGIGIEGKIPWTLKKEMNYFNRRTKTVRDPSKQNVVIMGRKTYIGIPEKFRPLAGRINIVLTRDPNPSNYPEKVYVNASLEDAMKRVETELKNVESVWIVGGNEVYKEALSSPRFDRLYLTEVRAKFECDAFFPQLPSDLAEVPLDDDIPNGVQEENGIQYVFKIFERKSANGFCGDK